MDGILPNLLLVLCGLLAVIGLVLTYLWYFVFGRSLRAILMAGLSMMMNQDSTIDLDAEVVVEKRPEQVKEEMSQEIEALDFEESITTHDQYIPKIATDDALNFSAQTLDTQPKTQEFVSSSFKSGRFRRVKQIFTRPFLKTRINPQSTAPAQNVKRKADSSNTE